MTARRHVEKGYLDELNYRLQMGGLPPDKIGDILAEVETHVIATGEPARMAFGPPAEYAAMWANRPGRLRWPATALAALLGACSGFALSVGALGIIDGEPTLGLSPWSLVGLGLVLLAACAAIAAKYLIDPLTGQRATGIRRTSLAVLTGGAVLIFVAGFGAMVAGALMLGRGDPVVGLSHWWLVAVGFALVVAAAAIFPVVRITDPRTGRPFFQTRRRLVLTIPALAVVVGIAFLGVGVLLR